MVQATEVFGGSARQIREAQVRFAIEAAGAQDKIEVGQSTLERRDEAKHAFETAIETLNRLSRGLEEGRLPDADIDARLSDMLRPRYTMAQERRVHNRFDGLPDEEPKPEAAETAEEADAFFL